MATTHTPAPWTPHAEDSEEFGKVIRIVGADLVSPCIVFTGVREAEDNAALIAAAPDLLALAERVAEHFADTDAPLGQAARAAIAKATATA